MNPRPPAPASADGRTPMAANGAQPKYFIPSVEAPPSYSSLHLAPSTNEPLLLPSQFSSATNEPLLLPSQFSSATNGVAVRAGEPPSYDTLGLGGTIPPPPPPPPKWESVPLSNVLPASAAVATRQCVVVTSPQRDSLPKVCCCMPPKCGTIFLAVLEMVWIAWNIFGLSVLLACVEELYEHGNEILLILYISFICLFSILLVATLILIVCGIVKRRREFFTYYFILFGLIHTLSVVAYILNTGITDRNRLLLIFDLYYCWKLIRYYKHLGRSVQVVATQ